MTSKLTQIFKSEFLFKTYGIAIIGGGFVNSIYKATIEKTSYPIDSFFNFIEGSFTVMWAPVIIPGYVVSKMYKYKSKH